MPLQRFEATLATPFAVTGRGLHTNGLARISVEPAPPRHGIRFSVGGAESVALHWTNRVASRFNTALRLPDGGCLRTVEHLSAGLTAFGVDNALVRVEGGELPIFDGSALPWCDALARAGVVAQAVERRWIRIVRPVQVVAGTRFLRVEPADAPCLDVTCPPYYGAGTQAWRGRLAQDVFRTEIAPSRSSGQVSRLWEFGAVADRLLAPLLRPVGGRDRDGRRDDPVPNAPRSDLPNALTPDLAERMRNPPRGEPVLRGLRPGRAAIHLGPFVLGGTRFPDERVRHNTLDLIGDLLLAGAPLLGRVVAHRPTHKLTYAFVAALMSRAESWTIGPAEPLPTDAAA